MKGLWKYIAPFAPDQSGACAVLYELGGITIITDAGGCTGNICGFDEPRWFESKSAIFSAGLRDMDAILGRDEKLVEKLRDTVKTVEAKFAAIIGTPVPAVIASDYNALRLMAERSAGIPVIAVETNGMELYDTGAARTYVELIDRFTGREAEIEPGRMGVLGAIPLDLPYRDAGQRLRKILTEEGWSKVSIYGLGSGLDEISTAGAAERNLVVSPSGISAAKRLNKLFGTPYELRCPLVPRRLTELYPGFEGKKVLVVHQAVMAETICSGIKAVSPAADVTAATWFSRKKAQRDRSLTEDMIYLTEEDQFIDLVREGGYDVIIADDTMKRAIRDYEGTFIDLPHFAVSGRTEQNG